MEEKELVITIEETNHLEFKKKLTEAYNQGYTDKAINILQGIDGDYAEPIYCAVMKLNEVKTNSNKENEFSSWLEKILYHRD